MQEGDGASPAADPRRHGSMMSAFDDAYIVSQAQVAGLRRNAVVASFGYAMITMGYVILGVAMPFSLNYIINGSEGGVSPESSSYYSYAVFVTMACALVVQEAWGRGGGWFGRQKILAAIAVLAFVGSMFALLAHLAKMPELWILCSAFIGLSSACFSAASSYCADMSTADNFAMTAGVLSGFGAFGVVSALIVQAAFSGNMVVTLSIALSAFLIGFLVFAGLLPDLSPPLAKREAPTMTALAQAAFVCSMARTFVAQTRYTKCLLMSIFCTSADFACLRMWLFSYGLIRFAATAQSISVLLVCTTAGGGFVIILGTRFLPTQLGCNLLMWVQVLMALICMVGPGVETTLWVAFSLSCIDALSGSFLNTMYFGQLSGRRRGELSALHSVASTIGSMVGLFVITPILVMWLESYFTAGEGTSLTPPMAQLFFVVAACAFYYAAQLCLRRQDKFGVFVLRTAGGDGADDIDEVDEEVGDARGSPPELASVVCTAPSA